MQSNIKKFISFDDLILLCALFVALGLAWNTVTAMQRNFRLQQKFNRLSAEVELYELENQNLKYNIAYLKTDDYLEIAAKEKFNKALPGETLVYLPHSGTAPLSPTPKNTVQKKEVQPEDWRSNFNAWWEFLQGKNAPNRI